MTGSRRTLLTITTSLTLVAALAVGMGVSVADANSLTNDIETHPINLGDMHFPMSRSDSQFIANQLQPVKRQQPELKTPRPGYSDFFSPNINVDPWLADNPVRAARYRKGDVIDIRESDHTQLWFPGVKGYQVLFRSTDSRGYPMIASAMLMIPPKATPNKNVLVWNQPINASGADCGIVASMNRPSTGFLNTPLVKNISPALRAGYPVLMPDGMGPRNAYAINRLASHIILDAMRMVHKQQKFELSKSKFVVIGISHGGLMTGYAAVEQGAYAPELTRYINQFIIHEGAPDLIKLAQNFGLYGDLGKFPTPWGGFLTSYFIGAVRENGDLLRLHEAWLNESGRRAYRAHSSMCLPWNLFAGMGSSIPTYYKDGYMRSKTFRTMMQIAKDNSMIYFPGMPKVPVMLLHGTTDQILYLHKEDEYLFNKWCKAGVNAVYQEIPLGDHFSTIGLSAPRVIYRIMQALENIPQKSGCGGKIIL